MNIGKAKPKKKNHRSLFYRISAWLHLWLGLASGIVIVIICLTGITWSFRDEITDWLNPELKVEYIPGKAMLSPAVLYEKAKKLYPNQEVSFIWRPAGKAAMAGYGKRNSGFILYIHPYTGDIIRKPSFKEEFDFFDWTLNGHRFYGCLLRLDVLLSTTLLLYFYYPNFRLGAMVAKEMDQSDAKAKFFRKMEC